MEPAGDRRDDELMLVENLQRRDLPQWSPPVIGGTTIQEIAPVQQQAVPQWSPPVIGGTTVLAGNVREVPWLPQWSPPVIGGTTSPTLNSGS